MALDKIIVEYELQLKKFDKQTKAMEKRLEDVEKAAEKSAKDSSKAFEKSGKKTEKAFEQSATKAKKSVNGIGDTVKKVGGLIAAAFTVGKIIEFGRELVAIQMKAEGIEAAFKALNNPRVLDQLRKATKGTVSDLVLMQRAVQANNFKIPLEQLGKLFEFARRRAKGTGESVDFLVDSIVTGLGRKSPQILDNLGISASKLKEAMGGVSIATASIGDVTRAVGSIIDEEAGSMAEDIDTVSEAIARNTAAWENMKRELADSLAPAMKDISQLSLGMAELWSDKNLSGLDKWGLLLNNALGRTEAVSDKLKEYNARVQESADKAKLVEEVTMKLNALKEADVKVTGKTALLADLHARRNFQLSEEITKVRETYALWLSTQEDGEAITEATINNLDRLKTELSDMNKQLLLVELGSKAEVDLLEQITVKTNELSRALTAQEKIRQAIFDRQKEETVTVDPKGAPNQVDVSDPVADEQALQDKLTAIKVKVVEEDKSRNDEARESEVAARIEQFSTGLSQVQDLSDAISSAQIATLESQLKRGLISQETFDKKSKKILEKQAKRDKALALFRAVIDTAAGIAQAVPNIPLVVLAGIIGAAQIATIAAKPIPQFAEGVVGLEGKGTETSDSIPALLSKNESVITAKGTRQDKGLFEAANRLQLDKYINDHYVLPELAKAANVDGDYASVLQTFGAGLSGSDVGIRGDLKGIKNQSKTNTKALAAALSKAMRVGNNSRYW